MFIYTGKRWINPDQIVEVEVTNQEELRTYITTVVPDNQIFLRGEEARQFLDVFWRDVAGEK